MRDIIPLRDIIHEPGPIIGLKNNNIKISTTVYEDNQSFIKLATKEKFRPRTKHIAVKYHVFCQHVKASNRHIQIKYVDTKNQLTEILNKSLRKDTFIYLLKKLVGWFIILSEKYTLFLNHSHLPRK